MVDLILIKNYFPEQIRNNALLGKSRITALKMQLS